MGLLRLDVCCCGCSLKVGSIIIASIELFFTTVMMGFGITSAFIQSSRSVSEYDIIIAIVCLCLLSVSIALLVGTIKGIHSLILPWLILVIVNTFVMLVSIGIAPVIVRFFHPNILAFLLGSPIIAARFYSIIIIGNLYSNLKTKRVANISLEENIAFVNNV